MDEYEKQQEINKMEVITDIPYYIIHKFPEKQWLVLQTYQNNRNTFILSLSIWDDEKRLFSQYDLFRKESKKFILDQDQIRNKLIEFLKYQDGWFENEEEIKKVIFPAYTYLTPRLRKTSREVSEDKQLILKIDNYIDNVEIFYEQKQKFFYDQAQIYWVWNKEEFKWETKDEIDIMNMIDQGLYFGGQTISSTVKNSYLEAFKRVGRLNTPKEPKKSWVQFKDIIFDFETKEIIKADEEYFICNPIPYSLGETDKTPVIDKLFEEWVGKEYVMSLYEIIAYCCIADYPIHLIFCLTGCGRNGKTQFQRLLTKFIGKNNTCSTELDTLISSRFESAKLFKKLVCTLGETNFGIINQTSLLKKLCGQDLIGYEFKQKKPFDDYNYAKILINSNSLPTSEDTSEGFYRRWFIIDFPNTFEEGKDIVETIPEKEFNNLARKITTILPKLMGKRQFTNQGTIDERKAKYILSSNPLGMFIERFCYTGSGKYVKYGELYSTYNRFLTKIKRRNVKYKEFTSALTLEGYEISKTSKKVGDEWVNDRFIEGVSINKEEIDKISSCDSYDFVTNFSINFPYREINKNLGHTVTRVTKILEFIEKEDRGFGVHWNELKTCLDFEENDLKDVIEKLKEKGDIFVCGVDRYKILK